MYLIIKVTSLPYSGRREKESTAKSLVPPHIQELIDGCRSVPELIKLLFLLDIEDVSWIEAFTRKRLELEGIDPRLMDEAA